MLNGFQTALGAHSFVTAIRGKGLMIGVELDRPCGELVRMALDKGLLINVTADKVVRLLPPLILSDDEADQIVSKVSELVIAFGTANKAA
jgi:acetylornithine aminotransferase